MGLRVCNKQIKEKPFWETKEKRNRKVRREARVAQRRLERRGRCLGILDRTEIWRYQGLFIPEGKKNEKKEEEKLEREEFLWIEG